MKIMKFVGVVMALHVSVLVVIFANPGCSSARSGATTRPTPADSVSSAAAPLVMPVNPPLTSNLSPIASMNFDPNAPAVAESSRAAPLRPGSTSAAAATRPAPVPEPATTISYTVVGGDSLWAIANKNRITVSELAAANKIPGDSVLKPGQKLVIPVKAGMSVAAKADPAAKGAAVLPAPADAKGAAAAAKKGATGTAFNYTVQNGETLSSIALKFKVSAADIATENSLPDRNLVRAGMILLIPDKGGANAAAAAKGDATKAGAGKAGGTSNIETIGPPRPQSEIPTIKINALPAAKR